VEHTLLTGSKTTTNEFTFGVLVGSVECSIATFDGTAATQVFSEITLKPAYAECKGLKREVTTHMNGCAYVIGLIGEGTDGKFTIESPVVAP
jgi:hypothetical protein